MTDRGAAGSGPEPPAPGVPVEHGWDRVVLIGFMGAGKTTVGKLLARSMGWTFLDLDHEVVRVTGRDVDSWFSEGESEFRRVEAEVAIDALKAPETVLATGGGWAAQPGNLEAVPASAVVVWLDVTADAAVERTRLSKVRRPLLDVVDPIREARVLLKARIPAYGRSRIRIDTVGRTAAEVTELIKTQLKRMGD